jgi:septal ring factor EnvC (AmiA/AmiB activator)
MSSLLILLSVAGILGVWLVERPLSDTAVAMLRVVEESTATTQAAINRTDQALVKLQGITTQVQDASQQLNQNVTDKGLVMVLLPEEQEQTLTETAASVQDTFSNIRETIRNSLDLYRSINRLPFVSLPGLDENQVETIATSVEKTQALAGNLRTDIADFRSGVSSQVNKLTGTADQLNNEITQGRDRLAQLDTRLAALGDLAIRLQQVIPGVLLALAVILSLIFAFLIFTQVEVIRLYVDHWRLLGTSQETNPPDSLAQPVQ